MPKRSPPPTRIRSRMRRRLARPAAAAQDAVTVEDELQGRAGERLPNERPNETSERVWEHEAAAMQPPGIARSKRRHRRAGNRPRRSQVVREIQYERGPGSRYQIEGRGPGRERPGRAARAPRRKRS